MQNTTSHSQPVSLQKTVLITGSSSGIGQASALAFAKQGYKVIASIRNQTKAQELLAAAKALNVELDIRNLDVCDDASVNACVNAVLADYGSIDILINNAGTGYRGSLEQTPIEDLQRMMDVNYYSVARMTKALLPSMRSLGKGRIITISSLGGLIGVPFCDAYCAAKFAIEGLMESLAPVVAKFGIYISLIEPGPVNTNFIKNVEGKKSLEAGNPYAELEAAYVKAQLQRFSAMSQSADDIANIIVQAASEAIPQFRYQTSPSTLELAAFKHVDITGDKMLKTTSELILQAN